MKKYDGKTGILLQLDAENCKNRNKQLSVTSVIRIPFLFVLLSPLLFFQRKKKKKRTWAGSMQRASPHSLASAIWKSALLFTLFEQSYYKVTSKPCMLLCIFFLIIHMLHHFDLHIVNFPFRSSTILYGRFYGVYISQLIRYA